DRQIERNAGRQEPAPGAGGLPGRRLRGRCADEHLLQPSRRGRAGVAAHALRGPRGCTGAVRVRHAPRARDVQAADQDFRRRAAHRAVRAQRNERGGHRPRRDRPGCQPVGQGAGHRQEDGRAAAAGTERQGRRRPGCRGRSGRGRRHAGRHPAGVGGTGLQRQGSAGGAEGAAPGRRRERRHQARAQGACAV
ncbi:MAG: RuvA, partial [uncultured Ramlibacter sp.]